MTWGFEPDNDYRADLEWVDRFVTDEVEPIDRVVAHAWDVADPLRNALIKPLQQQVRERKLWACHLGPELGGPGFGQLKLALLNEKLGRTHSGPVVFGCQAPDSGNAEILAHYGTPELKRRYLEPLLENEIVSAYSMTEPQGGSDPTAFLTRAELDGDEWVINGEKWFSSHASFASFLIVMAVTDPEADRHHRASMFVVPADTPGIEIIRDVEVCGHENLGGTHAYIRYTDVRIPRDHLLGERGQGFAVAQTRLGGGRIHHAMRTVGLVQQSLDMMLERAVSRSSRGGTLADHQLVQEMIADSWIQLQQFRLLVLQTAWKIDKYNDYRKVLIDISAVKAAMPKVLLDVAGRAIQLHGSLGISTEMPFGSWVMESYHMGLADGATELHKIQVAKQLLRRVEPATGLFPSGHLPARRDRARDKFRDVLEDLELA
ncbi:acyl-CoA dehydrogenase family protein [Nocardia sp. CA2R105]|uniref:acyl-CoA dehydrogenase family protein n=1 Tax=Nocardia coffeae TaxID=2873381 RepID=UPI001CA6FD28|nr:acyl-CoA dehydrogenase family protein [Nocardia coffeae]MBY8857123.1 acyl-CoA dehydrogenase family protein [Nocardia coffeae]